MFDHKHPLSLIDLQPYDLTYEDEEEEEDDDLKQEIAARQEFRCVCDRCGEEINWFHRYYYNCNECVYSIHKFCAQLPPTLEHHPSHIAHPLTLLQRKVYWRCDICRTYHQPEDLRYRCSQCDFDVDVNCAVKWLKNNIIHHPSHIHPLVPITRDIMCLCDACGKKHEGIFYQCTTCPTLFLHKDCVFLPKRLKIQDATDGSFSHTHPLTLAYSFPEADRNANHYPRCRVCGRFFVDNGNLWIYKCEDCRYYTHLDCATAREEPFMSILSTPGLGKTIKFFDDADYPNLLRLPLPDQTDSLLKHIFFKQMASSPNETLQHKSHQHPLILVDAKSCDLLLLHNPMKKIELLCNGCLRPITDMPFYKCTTTTTTAATAANQECHDFVLHEWCTRLPDQVIDHPGHPQHPLLLLPKASHYNRLGVIWCDVCGLPCNGFAYSCVDCNYDVDVNCAFIPDKIAHEAHPNHLISRVQSRPGRKRCRSCVRYFADKGFSYSCGTCEFDLHPECALFLPQTIRHKSDKHPMKLSYFPIENHSGQYFCEVCEEDFDPKHWFYHCYDCVQSIHSACSPLILDCRRAGPKLWIPRKIYQFLNVKFGGIHNIEEHAHPVSFDQGIQSDGRCNRCWFSLWYKMIFRCLECKFVIHFSCCMSLNN